MQNDDLTELEKKAVKAAVNGDWETAKQLNIQVLEIVKDDINTKARLGKAYLELRDYTKAKKYFKEVLAVDPINAVTIKNLELAKEEKHAAPTNGTSKSIIKEPATFAEAQAQIVARGFTAGKIPMGTPLELRVMASQTKVFYEYKNRRVELAVITEPIIQKRLKAGKEIGSILTGTYVKGSDKEIAVLINSSLPIFQGERQELKPYTKRDFLNSDNEPEPIIEEN